MSAIKAGSTFELEFGHFTKFDRHILGIPHLYANVGIAEAREINEKIGSLFSNTYGYIGDRRNEHSVDPRVYLMAPQESNLLKCVAIVVYSEASRNIAQLEKQAADTAQFPFEVFDDVESAKDWVEKTLNELAD